MSDPFQGALFGLAPESSVDHEIAGRELRLCALNVNSASGPRAAKIAQWLVAAQSNVLVLTELRVGEGARHLTGALRDAGYEVTSSVARAGERYSTVVASRGYGVTRVASEPGDSRILALDLEAAGQQVRLVGVYGVTNGMTPDSSRGRAAFQGRCLDYLSSIRTPSLCVAGDLNVLDSPARRCAPAFEEHDFAFYDGLVSLGLRDVHVPARSGGEEFSWISDRFGAQRLDYILAGPEVGTVIDARYDHGVRVEKLSDHAAALGVIRLAPRL